MADIERLKELQYHIAKTKSLGFPPQWEMVEEVKRIESEIISQDLVPVVRDLLTPELTKLSQPLDLTIRYVPDCDLEIKIEEITADNPKQTIISTEDDMKGCRIKIVLQDGRVIDHNNVSDTITEFVKYAGAERVRSLSIFAIERKGIKIVMTRDEMKLYVPTNRYVACKQVGTNLFIYTNTNTRTKFAQIQTINSSLNLGAKIYVSRK